MNIAISEFLKEYCPELPDTVRAGEIYKLTYTEDLKHFRFLAHFGAVVPADDIFAFERQVAEAIKVESVRLFPRYDEKLFGLDCYGELIKLLKRDISVVNGFLDGAEVKLGDGKLTIELMHGGRDILEKFRFAATFRQMIYNQFGVQVNVELLGGEPVSSEKFDA